jgi:signal transduction histidine kinase
MKNKQSISFYIFILFTCLLQIFSCSDKNEKQAVKPWHHKDVIGEKYKWLLNSDNYEGANYFTTFKKYYNDFFNTGHSDSALFCLLAYGEMLDQNYIYDSFYLNTAEYHLQKNEPISTVNGELIKLYYYIGSQYETNSENKLAEDWYNRALKHPDILPRTRVKCLGMLSEVYESNNQYDKAIELQFERLEFYRKENDTINTGVTYSNIAGLYNGSQAYQNALTNIGIALKYSRLKNDTNTLIPMLTNYFIYEKNAARNFVFTPKHILVLKELNTICDSYSRLSPYNEWVRQDINFNYYYNLNKVDSMKYTLDKISEVVNIINSPSITHKYKFLSSQYQLKTGKIDLKESELIDIARTYEEKELWWEAATSYVMLLDLTESKGEHKKALEYLRKVNEIERRKTELNNKGQLLDLEIKYQTEKKNEELILQAEKLKSKQRDIVLLALLLVILVLLFFVYFIKQKEKIILEKRKTEALFTQQLMENTEEERKRIAKDLHDSIGHELLNIKNSISSNLQFSEKEIDHIIGEVREISRNLFPVMFEEIGLKLSLEQLAISTEKSSGLFISHELQYTPERLNMKQELNIYRIIQEAITNTLKYAEAKSAKIIIEEDNEQISIEYMDNGKGFLVDETLKSGKAFGLISMQQRTIALKGKIEINSGNEGTRIKLIIPSN